MQPGHFLKCRKRVIQRKEISTETSGKNPTSFTFLSFQKGETLLGRSVAVLVTCHVLERLVRKEGEVPTTFRIGNSFFKIKGA